MDSATKLLDSTLLTRQNGKTNSNYNSSRSHLLMILSINIASVNFKICIGDLAGSEKVSEERGKSQTEGKSINLSLSTFKTVITQLENNQSHVSWRNSVLTSCLKTFFDHGKVALIFHVDPTNVSESKQTFEFTAVCARVSKLEQQKSPLLKCIFY